MPDHVALSAFLAPLIAAVKSAAASAWVVAEVSEVADRTHLYVTLIETDAEGVLIAQLRASIWAKDKGKILRSFTEGTGGERLRKGLKVLLKLRPSLHPVYGLCATIEDIDPAFTLGEAAKKLLEIRKRLITEGLYERQRAFPTPSDFTSVAVVCPAGAAGLGDFRSHADPLQALGLCRFSYYTAMFQGERASAEIVSALRAVYRAHRDDPFDAVVILRGGGSQADLAWLNDYDITSAVTKMALPVFAAVGHERDTMILDEVANASFHTPSKAITHIAGVIITNARDAMNDFDAIMAVALRTQQLAAQAIERARETVSGSSRHHLRVTSDTITGGQRSVTAGAEHAVQLTLAAIQQSAALLEGAARLQVEMGSRESLSSIDAILAGAARSTTAAEHALDRARTTIHGAATKEIAVTGSDIDGRRLLIRDRSYLVTRTVGDRVKGAIEYVVGLGPEKTLQRGFVLARHEDGSPITRKVDLAAEETIELTFADGQVGARVE